MVNEEYLEEVKEKFGLCECGKYPEYIISSYDVVDFFHINFIGSPSPRATIKTDEKKVAYCFSCFRKKFVDPRFEYRFLTIKNDNMLIELRKIIFKKGD